MKLFDTDVLIEYLRGNPEAGKLLGAAVASNVAACSTLTRFELLAGMRSAERSAVRNLLHCLVDVEVTPEIANRAGEMARSFRKSHPGTSAVDYLIAATADVIGADLQTRNTRHFPMFPDLESAI